MAREPWPSIRERTEMRTPGALFAALDAYFGFTLDVCATALSRMCQNYLDVDTNGLTTPWHGVCWCSPPVGNIGAWMEKALAESRRGATVVCFIPVRTDTEWWWQFCLEAHEICFIKGWVQFPKPTPLSAYPSAIVVFRPTPRRGSYPVIKWWSRAPATLHSEPRSVGALMSPPRNGSPMAALFGRGDKV